MSCKIELRQVFPQRVLILHVRYIPACYQVVTSVDGYDEDYEKGKAAGIKMVRRMSMARLQRKYSQDPVSKQHLLLYTFYT